MRRKYSGRSVRTVTEDWMVFVLSSENKVVGFKKPRVDRIPMVPLRNGPKKMARYIMKIIIILKIIFIFFSREDSCCGIMLTGVTGRYTIISF